jgi:hypothetical protein
MLYWSDVKLRQWLGFLGLRTVVRWKMRGGGHAFLRMYSPRADSLCTVICLKRIGRIGSGWR